MTPDTHNETLVLAPYQLAVMYRAFDVVWDEVRPDYVVTPMSMEVGRLRLANAVLAAYQNGFTEPATMTAYARSRMAIWRHESLVAL